MIGNNNFIVVNNFFVSKDAILHNVMEVCVRCIPLVVK